MTRYDTTSTNLATTLNPSTNQSNSTDTSGNTSSTSQFTSIANVIVFLESVINLAGSSIVIKDLITDTINASQP